MHCEVLVFLFWVMVGLPVMMAGVGVRRLLPLKFFENKDAKWNILKLFETIFHNCREK